MSKLIKQVLFFMLLQGTIINAQTLDWGINEGGHTDDYPIKIHKVPGGLLLSSTIDGLRKYDLEGNLLWRFNFFDNVLENFFIGSSDVDEKGNSYVALSISGNWGETKMINGFEFLVGLNLVKLDPQGEVLWVRKFLRGTHGQVRFMNRKVYFTGNFLENMDINGEAQYESKQYYDCFSWNYRYGEDIFLSRFSDIGVLEESAHYGNDYHDYPASMEIDQMGNVFLAGMHQEYACVDSFSFLLKFDSDLNLVWEKKITTEEREEYLLTPRNLFLSENGKLYLIASSFYGISNEEFEIPNNLEWTYSIMEYDSITGDFLRLNYYAKGNWNENFVPPSPFINNLYLQDYKDDIIVFTSANSPLTFENKEFVPQPKQENLLLFRVNKKSFKSSYITHFEAEIPPDFPDYAAMDNPGSILMDGEKLYLTASFQSNPLHIMGKQIPNNSGNNDRDILIARMDLSGLADPEDELDDDQDGVINYKDYCPNTAAGAVVDELGCSSIQKDGDGDGIINRKDNCPDTRSGANVDKNGCEILQFPADNFILSTTSESCAYSRDASIKVEVKDLSYKYFLRFDDEVEFRELNDSIEITGLSSGSYKVCIVVNGYSPFEKCFTLEIDPPKPLSVYSNVTSAGTTVELQLDGGKQYLIQHNERFIETAENHLELFLENGPNYITVSTDKDCQGLYQEMIIGRTDMLVHPNPVEDYFIIRSVVSTGPKTVSVFNLEGQLVMSQDFAQGMPLKVSVADLPSGFYLVRVASENKIENIKLLKK